MTTRQGEGNGVGCSVRKTAINALKVRPADAYILQPPGSGKQTFVVGGGVPPYKLFPPSANDLKTAVATLDGSVLTVTASPGVRFGFIRVSVADSSSPFPQDTSANVNVLTTSFSPTFEASFHTLLGGSAPGLTMLVHAVPGAQNLRVEQMEIHLQGANIETSRLRVGDLLGLLRIFYSSDTYDFEQFTCIWEHRRFADNNAEKHKIGAYFYGEKGTLHIGWRDGWTFYPANAKDKIVHEDAQLQEPDGHNLTLLWNDFVNSIEGRSKGVANIELAHRASVLPLLGMISWRVGRSINWDGDKEQIIGDTDASKLLSRPYRAPWVYPTA